MSCCYSCLSCAVWSLFFLSILLLFFCFCGCGAFLVCCFDVCGSRLCLRVSRSRGCVVISGPLVVASLSFFSFVCVFGIVLFAFVHMCLIMLRQGSTFLMTLSF